MNPQQQPMGNHGYTPRPPPPPFPPPPHLTPLPYLSTNNPLPPPPLAPSPQFPPTAYQSFPHSHYQQSLQYQAGQYHHLQPQQSLQQQQSLYPHHQQPQYYMYPYAPTSPQSSQYSQHSYLYQAQSHPAQSLSPHSAQNHWKRDKQNSHPSQQNTTPALVGQTYHCEPCEKDFPNEKAYQAHTLTHDKCSFPGCAFQGTKRVVSVHYQLVHGTFSGTGYKMIEVEGMEFKVLMGTDPSEVEEWRNQRRKRFPTKTNIDQKEKDRQELKTAGGIERQQQSKRETKKRAREEGGAAAPALEDPKKIRNAETEPSGEHVASRSSSLSLVQDYGSCSESGEEREEVKGSDAIADSQPDIVRRSAPPCRLHLAGKCRKGDKCKYSHNSEASGTSSQRCSYFLKGKCRKGSRCPFIHSSSASSSQATSKETDSSSAPAPLLPPSLFRKLVASELHSEENVLLQCIRFFAQEKFFSDP